MKQNVYFHIITTDWHDSMVYPSSNPLYWNVNHVFPPVAWSIRYIYYVDNWAVLLVWNCNGNPLTYGTFSNSGKHTPRRTVDLQNVMNPHRRSRWIKKIVHIFFGLLHLHRKLNVWVHASFQFRFFSHSNYYTCHHSITLGNNRTVPACTTTDRMKQWMERYEMRNNAFKVSC